MTTARRLNGTSQLLEQRDHARHDAVAVKARRERLGALAELRSARLVAQQRDDRRRRLVRLAGDDDARAAVDLVEVTSARQDHRRAARHRLERRRRQALGARQQAHDVRALERADLLVGVDEAAERHDPVEVERPRQLLELAPVALARADELEAQLRDRRARDRDRPDQAVDALDRIEPADVHERRAIGLGGMAARWQLERQRHVDERLGTAALGEQVGALVQRRMDERRRLAQRAPPPQAQERALDQRLAALGGRRDAAHRLDGVGHAGADRGARRRDAQHGVQVVQDDEVEAARRSRAPSARIRAASSPSHARRGGG